MLAKKNRVSKKDIDFIFQNGEFLTSPSLTFKFVLNNSSSISRISFIVPKTVAKKAVNRNLLRRRGYIILEKRINKFPAGLLGVFVFKKYQEDVSILGDEVKSILNKIS